MGSSKTTEINLNKSSKFQEVSKESPSHSRRSIWTAAIRSVDLQELAALTVERKDC
ncbi:hypothetical protein ES703_24141 [subsurface metagenome]